MVVGSGRVSRVMVSRFGKEDGAEGGEVVVEVEASRVERRRADRIGH